MRYDDNKQKYILYAIYALIAVAVCLLQNSRVAFPEIFGARAFLLVPLCVAVSMHEREIPAALFGVFSGILWDLSSGNDGFNAFVLMILSAVCSVLISHIMRKNIITAFVLSAGAVFIYDAVYVLGNIILSGAGAPWNALFTFYLPSAVYTLAFVPVLYYLVNQVQESYKRS